LDSNDTNLFAMTRREG